MKSKSSAEKLAPFHLRRSPAPPPPSRFPSSPDMVAEFPFHRRIVVFLLFLAIASFSCFLFYTASDSIWLPLPTSRLHFVFPDNESNKHKLERVLKNAATRDKTVILTTLNEAWAAPNSVLDLFLESFKIGEHTRSLLNHLVIIALDKNAYARCLVVHTHCFALQTEGVDFSQEAYFMTPDYLKMMWTRIDFLRSVLEMGYNFVFTDADIMWFRNPFGRFYLDADIQIACDHFSGNSYDMSNKANGGFNYVRTNKRTVEFYKWWYNSRERYPGNHDQDVLNNIKYDSYMKEIDLNIRFLNTAYFGGLCEPSRDFDVVCTMHVNCCFGLYSKLHDLRIMLHRWKLYMSLPPSSSSGSLSWGVPHNCSLDALRRPDDPELDENAEQG